MTMTTTQQATRDACEKCGENHGARHLPCPEYKKMVPVSKNKPAPFRVAYRPAFFNTIA